MNKNQLIHLKSIANWENTAVIIPIYNSEKHLSELLQKILIFFSKENIFAINDASNDNSKVICEKFHINLINFTKNHGKGAALQTGFKKAIENKFAFAFSIDSDLQHQTEDFPKFIKKQNTDFSDLVIGKRNFSIYSMPFPRILSNFITSNIVSFVTQAKIYDSQSGFRLYNLGLIKQMHFHSMRYQFETEIIFKFAKKSAKFSFVPIETIYNKEKSNISYLRDIKNFINVVLYEITHNCNY